MRKAGGSRPASGTKERGTRNKDLNSSFNTTAASGTKRKSILDRDGKLNESYMSGAASKKSPMTGKDIYRKSTLV